MRVDDFDFELPEANIALRPVVPRDAARMLVVNGEEPGGLADRDVLDLAGLLMRVTRWCSTTPKLFLPNWKANGFEMGTSPVSVQRFICERTHAHGSALFVAGRSSAKVNGSHLGTGSLNAQVSSKRDGGEIELVFDCEGPDLDAALLRVGHIPLPPYIGLRREDDARDQVDYQTIYARESGAVAAPTAGLHFTESLFEKLDAKGISRHFVTLHVGAGTFLPVKVDDTDDHKMHAEIGSVSKDTAEALNAVRQCGGRIVSVGTTSLRLLESAAQPSGEIQPWSGATDIFITPGYKFRAVDALMTNFHLPKSTLFMLVSAFAGQAVMKRAYQHAIAAGYRFYSYGDSSLLFPETR